MQLTVAVDRFVAFMRDTHEKAEQENDRLRSERGFEVGEIHVWDTLDGAEIRLELHPRDYGYTAAVTFVAKQLAPDVTDVSSAYEGVDKGTEWFYRELLSLIAKREKATRRGPVQEQTGASPLTEPLTPREQQTLAHLARGLTNRQIASLLGVELNTIKGYVRLLLKKLGAQDRDEAVTRARSAGLLPEDAEG